MLNHGQDKFFNVMLGRLLCVCLASTCWVLSVSAATPGESATSSSDSAHGNQRKTISVWTHMLPGSVEGDVFTRTAQAFEQAQDEYAIEAVPIAPETYADRVIGSAQSGSLPCVLEFDGPYLYNFAWSGYLQPIDRFVPARLKADILPSIITQGSFNGQLYSLGQFDSGLAIYGNRRYLQAAGVRIPGFDDPWNLREFEEALEKLTALPEVEYALDLKMNYGRGEYYTATYSLIILSFGGDLIDRSGYQQASGVLDGAQSVKAMQHFQSWIQKGWVGTSITTDDDFYGAKKAALSWVGHWMYNPHAKGLGEDLVVLPMPDFGHGSKTTPGSWSWSITSNCSDPKGAWAFIEHMLSPREIMRMTDANGAVPARQSVLKQSRLYSEKGPLRLFVQQLESERAVPRPITPAYATISSAFAKAADKIIYGADVKTELSRAAREIDQDIEAHQGYPID